MAGRVLVGRELGRDPVGPPPVGAGETQKDVVVELGPGVVLHGLGRHHPFSMARFATLAVSGRTCRFSDGHRGCEDR